MPTPPRADAAHAAAAPAAVSADHADWSREAKPFWRWDPGRSLLASLRAYDRARRARRRGRTVRRWLAVVRHRFWSVVTGADIPLGVEIGGGLMLPHPNGIVIHPETKIGVNCLLFQQVTLGVGGPKPGAPRLGGHVDIGADAKVLGGVSLGAHARVGANAVVLIDVPRGVAAVGVPARVVGAP